MSATLGELLVAYDTATAAAADTSDLSSDDEVELLNEALVAAHRVIARLLEREKVSS